MLRRLQKHSNLLGWLALAGGLGLFAVLVSRVGFGPAWDMLKDRLPLVLGIGLAYGLFQLAYCMGWAVLLRPLKLPFPRLFGLYLAGDALSYAVSLAGEPLKARLLKPHYTGTQGVFSVSVAKFCEALAQFLFYLVGMGMVLFAFPLPERVRWGGVAVLVLTALGLGLLFSWQRNGIYGAGLRLWEKLVKTSFPEETKRQVEELDRMISAFYRDTPLAFAACVFWKFIGKLGGAVEAALFIAFLGREVTFAQVVAIETLAMVTNDMLFFIPGRAGGAESGRVLIFVMMGYTPQEGLAYALVRRVRELIWVGAGLGYMFLLKASPATKREVERVLAQEPAEKGS